MSCAKRGERPELAKLSVTVRLLGCGAESRLQAGAPVTSAFTGGGAVGRGHENY